MKELKEHGFRLEMQINSLPNPTGPITGGEIALVIGCDTDSIFFSDNSGNLVSCGDRVRFVEHYPHATISETFLGMPKKNGMTIPVQYVSVSALLHVVAVKPFSCRSGVVCVCLGYTASRFIRG